MNVLYNTNAFKHFILPHNFSGFLKFPYLLFIWRIVQIIIIAAAFSTFILLFYFFHLFLAAVNFI